MPGYEVFSEDGTLIWRGYEGNFNPISQSNLKNEVAGQIRFKIDGITPTDPNTLDVQVLGNGVYINHRNDHAQSNIVRRQNGTTETAASWHVKFNLMNGESGP